MQSDLDRTGIAAGERKHVAGRIARAAVLGGIGDREDLVGINQGIVQDVVGNLIAGSPNTLLIVVTNPLDTMAYVAYQAVHGRITLGDMVMYFQAFQRVIDLGTRPETAIAIETPLIHLDKAGIVRLGLKLEAPLNLTWSCYQAQDLACGRCSSCRLRLQGFAAAGVPDPIPYQAGALR